MKKFFRAMGMLTLICFSFFYTERTANVVKQVDQIMVNIKEFGEKKNIAPIEPMIKEGTIIPGLSGSTVDLNKSYQAMKRYGSYYEPLLEFKSVAPKKSLKNNYGYYIAKGNPNKKMVSLLFLVNENDDITDILSILKEASISATFFLDGKWLENHNEDIPKLVKAGHLIGNLSYNRDYADSSFVWMDTIIKKIGKQKVGYCYSEEKNETTLKNCKLHENYTILPTLVVKNYPYKEIKEKLAPGSFISLKVDQTTKTELKTIIDYIESRGYSIETLKKHLQE